MSRKCCFEVWASDAGLGMKPPAFTGGKTPFPVMSLMGTSAFASTSVLETQVLLPVSPKSFCPISRWMYRVRTGNDKKSGVWDLY